MNQQLSDNENEKMPEIPNSPKATNQEKSMKRKDFWRGVGLSIGLIVLLRIVLVALTKFDSPSNEALFIRIFEKTPYYFAATIGILILFLSFKRPQMARGMLVSIGILIALYCIFIIVLLLFVQQ